jgi:protein associated with RNAse G/E
MPDEISLIKRNHRGIEVWRYSGRLIKQTSRGVLVEAAFNRSDLPFHGLVFKHNDRFLELYLVNHWFNIYEIHDRNTGAIKGWYCNVTRPAEIQTDQIAYDDLALDLLVFLDGRQLVLDEDEFTLLGLTKEEAQNAQGGLDQLKEIFNNPALFSFDKLLGRD